MADNKDSREGRDASRVSASDEYEVKYVADKLNVSAEEVKKAIERVGNDSKKIEEFLKKDR